MNMCWAVGWAVQTLSVELTDVSVYENVSQCGIWRQVRTAREMGERY